MIAKINIKNFKSLEDVAIQCSFLNVLTGLNGMGKSSVIQTLLLIRQSFERGFFQDTTGGLSLNGELVQIGTTKDALYQFAIKDEINFNVDFEINSEIENKSWFFTYEVNDPNNNEDEDTYAGYDFMPFSEGFAIPDGLFSLSLFKRNTFKYLHADRLVKNDYETSDFQVIRNRSIGKHGEFTAHFISHFGAKPVHPDLLHQDNETNTLQSQISAWMGEVSPGTKVIAERIAGANSVKLRYEFEDNRNNTAELLPLNVGFGITYALPVLTALLSARVGDILIIENPESHIHPKGQSAIGTLISRVANLGVQIFVETHSDHIINGILIASKNFENDLKGIDKKYIRISHAYKKSFRSDITLIGVLEGGKLSEQPTDFFDQNEIDLSYLLGF